MIIFTLVVIEIGGILPETFQPLLPRCSQVFSMIAIYRPIKVYP